MQDTHAKLLLDIDEVAQLTGFSVGTLYHWVSEGRIPCVRISSRCIRFRLSELEKWVDNLSHPVSNIRPMRSGPAETRSRESWLQEPKPIQKGAKSKRSVQDKASQKGCPSHCEIKIGPVGKTLKKLGELP